MDTPKIQVQNPGQRYIRNWIIYSAVDEPEVDRSTWKLNISGLVTEPRSFSYEELKNMDQLKYQCDFNCVTAWSIKDVLWEGPSLRDVILSAKPKDEADWVMFRCAEGYSTPVPLEYAMTENAVIALRINYMLTSSDEPVAHIVCLQVLDSKAPRNLLTPISNLCFHSCGEKTLDGWKLRLDVIKHGRKVVTKLLIISVDFVLADSR